MGWVKIAPDAHRCECDPPKNWSTYQPGSRWRCPRCGTVWQVDSSRYTGGLVLRPRPRWWQRLLGDI